MNICIEPCGIKHIYVLNGKETEAELECGGTVVGHDLGGAESCREYRQVVRER